MYVLHIDLELPKTVVPDSLEDRGFATLEVYGAQGNRRKVSLLHHTLVLHRKSLMIGRTLVQHFLAVGRGKSVGPSCIGPHTSLAAGERQAFYTVDILLS